MTIDIFTLLLLLFIIIGIIIAYAFFLQEKNQEQLKVEAGFCPKCKQKSMELIDIRGSGCSPKILTYRCFNCGYENSYTQKDNSCGSGGCSL